ncbi:MAG TPA: response regulator, partial [Oligoflexus sp.]|uniref:response regulator n=1 Tax=Oligoflexus sp. TaxID=1971216 RepID=UPI002D5BD2C0
MKNKKIRVLIVEDSAVMRKILVEIMSRDPGLEVVGTAPDALIARDKLVALKPDVMTLDISLPQMDGISFLEKVMCYFPTRTLVISSSTDPGSANALRAFSAGAIGVIGKPQMSSVEAMQDFCTELVER